MGFAWESANVRNSGMAEIWDYPPAHPRHRKPPRHFMQAAVARTAIVTATAAVRLARAAAARPGMADHRRAF